MKIAIIGYSGSGKSTLARNLGIIHNIPVLHLDSVNFTENWQERDLDESKEIVRNFMEKPSWIIEGNYGKLLRNERFQQADRIIFMDFPRFTAMSRAVKRYMQRPGATRRDMAPNCPEKMDAEFLYWLAIGGRTTARKRNYNKIMASYPHKMVRLFNQDDIDDFLYSETIMVTKKED